MVKNVKIRKLWVVLLSLAPVSSASAQYAWQHNPDERSLKPGNDISYMAEWQGSFSDGQTPLWLNANKHGLSSLSSVNGYLRGKISRSIDVDSARRWAVGYGVDVVLPLHYTSHAVVQQAYVEGRWLDGTLTIGQKEQSLQLKNNRLSTGSQTLGINARPVPEVKIALPQYWTVPLTHGWLGLKGHIAYGKLTDSRWERDFTRQQSKYTDGVFYHDKAGYLKIQKPSSRFSAELGLEMGAVFGGTSYLPQRDGSMQIMENSRSFSSFFHALVPGGADVPEQGTFYTNAQGDDLGSWIVRLNYEAPSWRLGVYLDKFFEDSSGMIFMDMNDWDTGTDWQKRKSSRMMIYDFWKDQLIGAELNLKHGRWVKNIVVEYLYTKYQSGPVYHDHTINLGDDIGGRDEYYNHYIYAGWQHWGQVMGNPLFRSPLYNKDGSINVDNNRFVAFHLGFDGEPAKKLNYRVLATYQRGFGTYSKPFLSPKTNFSILVEGSCLFSHQWKLTAAYGADWGRILGSHSGIQLTLSKSGLFNL